MYYSQKNLNNLLRETLCTVKFIIINFDRLKIDTQNYNTRTNKRKNIILKTRISNEIAKNIIIRIDILKQE